MSEETPPECNDFATIVKAYIINVNQTKELKAQMKTLRAKNDELSATILAFMETKSLDVCKINNGSECGELCATVKRSRPNLKRDQQISHIAEFFDAQRIEFQDGTSSTKADELYDVLQKNREQNTKKALVLRKSQ